MVENLDVDRDQSRGGRRRLGCSGAAGEPRMGFAGDLEPEPVPGREAVGG
jgi:hypothetical protein